MKNTLPVRRVFQLLLAQCVILAGLLIVGAVGFSDGTPSGSVGAYLDVAGIVVTVSLLATQVWAFRKIHSQLGAEPSEVQAMLLKVSSGDLSVEAVNNSYAADSVMATAVSMQEGLRTLVSNVRSSADSISTASGEIAAGNQDLSQRTE